MKDQDVCLEEQEHCEVGSRSLSLPGSGHIVATLLLSGCSIGVSEFLGIFSFGHVGSGLSSCCVGAIVGSTSSSVGRFRFANPVSEGRKTIQILIRPSFLNKA